MVKVFPVWCWGFSGFFSFPPSGSESPFASACLSWGGGGLPPNPAPGTHTRLHTLSHRTGEFCFSRSRGSPDPQSSRNVLPPSPDLCLRTIVCQTFLWTSRVREPCTVARELTWTGVHLSTSCSTWASCKGCGCCFVFSSAVVFQ